MLPSVLAEHLKRGIKDYLETSFPMLNGPFKGSVAKMLASENSLYHEPYVSVRLPFRQAEQMPNIFEAIHSAYLPYLHQLKAFERLTGEDGRSTLIATGTGSGKTECFLYPILEYCYQHRAEPGIKALIIYPMNALAADQAKRIAKLIYESPELRGNVTAGMYVGGQTHTASRVMSENGIITDHETMLNQAPDILLTNYKMLDYLLVRPKDARLWQDNEAETLKYVVVDELHTFDGAQGTDLACLLRRLKHRLGIYSGYLCCVGTSATMGSKDNYQNIIKYASEIFGEPFEQDAVITEERLSPLEFFANSEVRSYSLPSAEQIGLLEKLSVADDWEKYLNEAVKAWFPNFSLDVLNDEGRLALSEELMHHSFMQSLINLIDCYYYQVSKITEVLAEHYPQLYQLEKPSVLINSLFALISHARIGRIGELRPFLNVQVQLWMRELRRLVAKVDPQEVTYAIAYDLNNQQLKQYLPVVNCRDCALTGWVSKSNERNCASIEHLESFYSAYFKADPKICMMFPLSGDKKVLPKTKLAYLCPGCLQVSLNNGDEGKCSSCQSPLIEVMLPETLETAGAKGSKHFVCPCCGSRSGLSLMGLRSATEISASISQIFASKFNDDKKTLAFSDNVQDAAHRAGFFNCRTWKFGLRTAIQQYCLSLRNDLSLNNFQNGFNKYWHEKLANDEEFVGFFIAPNMTWKKAYEDMLEKRKLGNNKQAQDLIFDIEKRTKYEIMLEYGLLGQIGRTLEKSGCSVLYFDKSIVSTAANEVRERVINEIGISDFKESKVFEPIVIGFLDLMRQNGAFYDLVFESYVKEKFEMYMLSNDKKDWLPGVKQGRNVPRFPALYQGRNGSKDCDYYTYKGSKYVKWIERCISRSKNLPESLRGDDLYPSISKLVFEVCLKYGLICKFVYPTDYKVYGLNKEQVYVSANTIQLRCPKCGSLRTVSKENVEFWLDAPCSTKMCDGSLVVNKSYSGLDYYGKLYSAGNLARINAKEHTGLLEREERELLENDFKRNKVDKKIWDPNVLSCTPTLEMGIDVGDLSTVILCSMPPGLSQFWQRVGRAGRKDGNALTLAIANARPHDLYFYAEPLEMLAGKVVPPRVFLCASAVLERQFIAFCMDSWIKKGVPNGAIPNEVGLILNRLEGKPHDIFPFNFLNYVQSTLSRQINSFKAMFGSSLDESTCEELRTFARGKGTEVSPMYIKIVDVFQALNKEKQSLEGSIKELSSMIKELKSKPEDSSYNEDIKELNIEKNALMNVKRELMKRNVFNFLSDEGLLPNYAFPEAGIILRAILYRSDEVEQSNSRKNWDKLVYNYSRSASSALSEFAPNNSFYVDGKKLTVDQVDLTTAQPAKWRLCPNCSHLQLEESSKNVATCPRCGSVGWEDRGQVRTMLKVQMVYSNVKDYKQSFISDESEYRAATFYCKQLLVDVDEEHDIASAYRLDNKDFPFGYEFVRKAALREINFGEISDVDAGEPLQVSGIKDRRRGFKVCKYCGKIQSANGKPNHTWACKIKNKNMREEEYEECLFLYREFFTEVLRMLIPSTTMDATSVKQESFTAAFMLGMKEYFGNVDHLRVTISEVPISGSNYRKQYLVVYDTVPGGTGYLKQLMHNKSALIEIFEKALQVMENCSCSKDPQKDGCYHCLFAYRQSKQMANISRKAAIRMLKSILSGKDNIEKIGKLNDISVNPLFDSELEQRFIEAVSLKASSFSDIVRNGKHCYYAKFGNVSWEIEPQVTLDAFYGVQVCCKPDFVFWPLEDDKGHKPVAIFTDGFTYHKDIVADDTLKREAIRRSGNFRVWSLSFQDVQDTFDSSKDYCCAALDHEKMPGVIFYNSKVAKIKNKLDPTNISNFNLLIKYLELAEAEEIFKDNANAHSLAILDKKTSGNKELFSSWFSQVEQVKEQTCFTDYDYKFQQCICGIWKPGEEFIGIYAGITSEAYKSKENPTVCAILKDDGSCLADSKYEHNWNDFWHFSNFMQFIKQFVAVSSSGLAQNKYYNLPTISLEVAKQQEFEVNEQGNSDWLKISELLFDKEAKEFVTRAVEIGIPIPAEENIGYEVENDSGEVIALVEIAWPDKKIGFMTTEQSKDKAVMENIGWKIITSIDEAANYFKG